MVAAIERSYPQREIADASYRYQMAVDRKEKIIVGVNDSSEKKSRSTFANWRIGTRESDRALAQTSRRTFRR